MVRRRVRGGTCRIDRPSSSGVPASRPVRLGTSEPGRLARGSTARSCATDVRPTSDGPTKCVPRGDNSRAGQLLRTCLTWTVCAALHDLSLGRRSRSVHGENVRAAPPSPASRGSSHETPSYGHSHPWVQQSLLAFAHIDAQRSGHRRVGDAARQPIELNAGVIEQN